MYREDRRLIEHRHDLAERERDMCEALLARLRGEPRLPHNIYAGCGLRDLEVLSGIGGGTSDYAQTLANTLTKRAHDYYVLEQPSYRPLTQKVSFRDFKASGSLLVEFPGLARVGESAEYKHGFLSEDGEQITVASFGSILSLSRAAIANDDIRVVDDVARMAAAAVVMFENGEFWTQLRSGTGANGPVMRDGEQFFSTAHANLGSAGALSLTTLGEAFGLLRSQTSLAGGRINAAPKFLVVPPASEVLARELLMKLGASEITLIVEANITSSTNWYVFANPELRPAWVSGHLYDQTGPALVARRGFQLDGTEFRITTDLGIGPLDHRAAVKCPGA